MGPIKQIPNRTVVTSFASASSSLVGSDSSNAFDEGHYILHVACGPCSSTSAGPSAANTPLSCALSNQCVQTYDRETLKKVHSIDKAHASPITDLTHTQVASSGDPSQSPLLVTSGEDGFVKIFDLRVNASSSQVSPVLQFGLSKEEALSVSVGYNGSLVAVGGSKGNIHFFDMRNIPQSPANVSVPLGSYVDSHTDEVTKVRFQRLNEDSHETTPLLVSASEDGLACIFDTSKPSEEMAVKSVMNVGSPLRDVGFFGPSHEGLYCLTGCESMSVWHHDSAQRICDFGDVRNHLSSTASLPIQYLVGCSWQKGELNLLAGNTEGDCALFKVDAGSVSLKRILNSGHKGCIRSFIHSTWNDSIITGGEDSRLCEWNLSQQFSTISKGQTHVPYSFSSEPKSGGGVIKRKKKKKGHNPY